MYARRRRRYFALMTVSLTLFISASAFVRLFSVPLAVAMCVVAAVIPPIAAVSANRWDADDHWWDEPAPGETGRTPPEQQTREPEPDLPQPPPSRSRDNPTPDEVLWEEELRGYNGERFGRDS